MNPVRFAIVGFGHIGKRHATMIQQHPAAELVAVADIEPSLANVAKNDFDVPFFSSIEKLLQQAGPFDVLNICTPNGLHTRHSLNGLKHGVHVVCEKPMGLHKSDCESVISEALNQSRKVFIVMQNRFSPPAVWLKDIIERKRLGKIYMVQVNCYWNRGNDYYANSPWKGSLALDGGPLFTQFSHFIDIMYWLLGDIKNIHARFDNFNHQHNTEFEDSGHIIFDFVREGMGEINYSTSVWGQNFESSITLIGEKGTVKVGGQYMGQIDYCNIENYQQPELPAANPPNDYGSYKGSAANHHFIIENVIDTLQGNSRATTNALEGLKVVDMIERIYAQRK